MKIRILDWETLTSGDLSADRFKKYGDTEIYSITAPELAAERIGDADIVLCNKTPMTREVFELCPSIKYIGLFATGYNNVDLAAAKERGIVVTNSPAYSTESVAQHTFALILDLYSKVHLYDESVHSGEWERSRTFSYFNIPVNRLYEKTMAIIGYGSIGRAVAKIASAFGMRVIINTRTEPKDCPYETVSPEEAFSGGDIVSIHCPLTKESYHLVNERTLSLMKNTALLINTARGDIVDEAALCSALNRGKIAGAGLDVVSVEPMLPTDPLKEAKNCVITPHIGWAPIETRETLLDIVEDNLAAFIEGRVKNRVN
jgi:glycerate dehydrogenase